MAVEWKRATIGEVSERVAMGPFGSSIKVSTFVETGIPVISGQHLRGSRLEDGEFNFVSEEHADALKNANVFRGDVVFTHAGSIGQCAYIPETSKYSRYVLSQRQFYMRCDKSKVLPEFITYFFKSGEGRHALLANASQTGVPSIARPVTYVRTIEIPLPPITEQETIASVLGALDNKIDLNRQMNANLEGIARALFQSWFVDFDPVRARLDGRLPVALDAVTAALFPENFEGSPLGRIPKGWKTQRLPDAIEVNPRRTLKSGTIAPYLDMKNLPTQGHVAEEVIDREFSSGTKFQNGDTLLARITPCLENGKTGHVDFLEDGQIGWGSTEYIIFSPKPPLPAQFGYFLARSDALRTHAIQNMTGTSGRQRVASECFNNFWIAVPPPEIAHRFNELTAPLMAKIKANSTESRTLATLRDTLLPKLLSGELNVRESTT